MSADKDKKEVIRYRVQRDYDAVGSDADGIISVAVNDIIEVRRSDLPDDCSKEHPEGMFCENVMCCVRSCSFS